MAISQFLYYPTFTPLHGVHSTTETEGHLVVHDMEIGWMGWAHLRQHGVRAALRVAVEGGRAGQRVAVRPHLTCAQTTNS